MITCYFGVPGCGKSTFLAKFAKKELRRIRHGRSKYERVYSNFFLEGCYKIDYKNLGDYRIENSLILLDELAMDADNRNFKNFGEGFRDFFILHRHLGDDVIYCTQNFDMVDLKIRNLTQELWYLSKSPIPFLGQFTKAKRIFRAVHISEFDGSLTLGYRFCTFIEAIFTPTHKIVFRPAYYKMFDSFDPGQLANRPVFSSELWRSEKDLLQLHDLLSDSDSSAAVDD